MSIGAQPQKNQVESGRSASKELPEELLILVGRLLRRQVNRHGMDLAWWNPDATQQKAERRTGVAERTVLRDKTLVSPKNVGILPRDFRRVGEMGQKLVSPSG
jgi:hypothetical protein